MKLSKTLGTAALTCLVLASCKENTESTAAISETPAETEAATEMASADSSTQFETEEQKVSYIIGLNMGANLQAQGLPLDADLIALGIQDSMSGAEFKLTQEEIVATMQSFQQKMQEQQAVEQERQLAERQQMEEAHKAAAEKNLVDGKAFLEENAKKEGVQVTESGLQYKVITAGTGPKPTIDDTVTVHYRGTLINGEEFDSSHSRGQPATFSVGAVIPGWIEALQLMPEGSTWELYIPSDLAYGSGATGGLIGPNSTLIFEVELIKANAGSGDQ